MNWLHVLFVTIVLSRFLGETQYPRIMLNSFACKIKMRLYYIIFVIFLLVFLFYIQCMLSVFLANTSRIKCV